MFNLSRSSIHNIAPEPTRTNKDFEGRGAAGLLLAARDIHKLYGGFSALRGVDLDLYEGKVNVLIGANGAGKSTLMRILAGVEQPSSGKLFLKGRPVSFLSCGDASRQGISMVHQELNLLPNLSVAENIFSGHELHDRLYLVQRKKQEESSRTALEMLGQSLDPCTLVKDISLGRRQLVEVARALGQNAELLILDEPTSALGVAEVDILFKVIAGLKARGITIVYISHRLDELLRIGDRFTVLREGLVSGTGARAEVNKEWLCERMTGEPSPEAAPGQPASWGTEAVRVRSLSLHSGLRPILSRVSFSLARGETLGLFGLLGGGCTELLETIAGLHTRATGSVEIGGISLCLHSPREAMTRGIVYLSGDRKRDGLVPELTVRENITLGVHASIHHGFISRREESMLVRTWAERLKLRAFDLEQPVRSLSGGNQQKVLLARALLHHPRLLLMDEPTRGVDIHSKNEIHAILRELASQGLSILFASSEVEELRSFADRVLVMSRGSAVAEFSRDGIQEAALLPAASSDAGPTLACHV